MPYKLKKRGGGYKVTSPNHPQGFSDKPQTKAGAKKQLAAIYANTHGEDAAPADLEALLESVDRLLKCTVGTPA